MLQCSTMCFLSNIPSFAICESVMHTHQQCLKLVKLWLETWTINSHKIWSYKLKRWIVFEFLCVCFQLVIYLVSLPFFLLYNASLTDWYSSLSSGCESKLWHEPWTFLHWWLAKNISYIFHSKCLFLLWCLGFIWTSPLKFLLCIASGKASEFGPLRDGYMFETSTGLSRKLDTLHSFEILWLFF